MPTSFTPLLGLALPATGELSGTWGDTVNNSITSLVESAVAGTTTLNTDADVTLTTNTGASNQARQAVLLCTGARTAQRTITAPAQSKTYIVVNNTTGGFSVKLVGSGPTAGITVDSGERALVVWNGSDFVKLGYASGVGVFTSVVAGSGTAALPSYSFVGDTDTGMFSPAANTLAWSVGGTEGMRLDSSGNLGLGVPPSAWGGGQRAIDFAYGGVSSGSAIGTQLVANSVYNGTSWLYRITSAAYRYEQDSAGHKWYVAPSGTAGAAITFTQAMTLDSSGNLGIGQSGGSARLTAATFAGAVGDLTSYANTPFVAKAGVQTDIAATRTIFSAQTYTNSSTNYALTQLVLNTANNTSSRCAAITVDASGNLGFRTNGSSGITSDTTAAGTEWMRLDSSGNLGVGTTTPQSRLHAVGTLTLSNGGDITAVDQALGVVNFRSDDVSASSSGTFASIAARNEFPGAWDGTASRVDTYIAFSTASDATMAERMRLTSAGLLQLAAGNTGGGVALNNAANTSPTVLDWYEEGTFTPTLTGIGSPTYTTQSGSYTRIGNVVHFNITLNWTGGTNGASITVASLPFTAAGVNTPVSISVNYLGNASFTWTGAVKAYVSGGTTNISPVVESSGASNAALLNPNAGTKDMIISGTYRVA